jgi:pyrroloquinoline quinone biosynthesis protein E
VTAAPRPFGLLAELTHRCPLRCPYCSNATQLAAPARELDTAGWSQAFREAAELGVVHVFLSGGEPLLRPDLEALVGVAREVGLYSNLITSAFGLTEWRLSALKAQGLDSVQISFQADEPELADGIAGATAHERKLAAARLVSSLGLPLTVNVVLHRGNLDRLPQIIALAEHLGAQRLELANAQFYGWAFDNQRALLPTRSQVERAMPLAEAAAARLRGKMDVIHVLADYYGTRPKPCMQGWGQRHLTIDPEGRVLPCPTAAAIPGMRFDSVKEHPLAWIWSESEAFRAFRGTGWMPEPCQSCERRDFDHGGCRCQAALVTGDAARTDPACELAPDRSKLVALVDRAQTTAPLATPDWLQTLRYRENPR